MQRYNLNLKGGSYTEADTYDIVPIYRQQVVPGQTVSVDAQINLKTTSLTKTVTTPSLASVWFFYVPHRLVWDGWAEWISQSVDQTDAQFPVTSTLSDKFFDKDAVGGSVSALYRRAYKLVYNEYFSMDNNSGYLDITQDTDVGLKTGKNPEQFAAHLRESDQVDDPEFSVVANSIPLNEFYRAQMNARSRQRSQMTGDKYVDTLARMGVDASWMISERPEFLGTKSKLCGSQLIASTESASLGEEVSRFSCSLNVACANKHFAEHGYIIGVAALRPLLVFDSRGAADAQFVSEDGSFDWKNNFYTADNLQTRDFVYNRLNGFDAAPSISYASRFAYLKRGQWLSGEGSSWIPNLVATSFESITYPNGSNFDFFSDTELFGSQLAITSSVNLKGKTPVPNNVA